MDKSNRLRVMGFLNEVSSKFPDAVSFAAGRPCSELLKPLSPDYIAETIRLYATTAFSVSTDFKAESIFQYGRTAGIVHELIAKQLEVDHGICVSPFRIITTTGCQEALALCLPEICRVPGDTVLVRNPTYIGLAGAAYVSDVPVHALPSSSPQGGIVETVARAIADLGARGQRARAIYLIPDFDNPTGHVIPLADRVALIEFCRMERILILEDNPYGLFRFEGTSIPSMAELDKHGVVIHLTTYSKTISPALRMGAIAMPITLFGDEHASVALFSSIVNRKSFLTVNSSQISQAILGGILIKNKFSLMDWIKPSLNYYRRNRDQMLHELENSFGPDCGARSWTRPTGGFFISMDVGRTFGEQDVDACASKEGVIVMPMSFFAFDHSQDRRIRLSFSAVNESEIGKGIAGLQRYL